MPLVWIRVAGAGCRGLVVGICLLLLGTRAHPAAGQIVIYQVTRSVLDEQIIEVPSAPALGVELSEVVLLERDSAVTHNHAMGWLETGFANNPILTIAGLRIEAGPGVWVWIPEGVVHTHEARAMKSLLVYSSWFVAITRDGSGVAAHGPQALARGPLSGLRPGRHRTILTWIDFPRQPSPDIVSMQVASVGGAVTPTVAIVRRGTVEVQGPAGAPYQRLATGGLVVIPAGDSRLITGDSKLGAIVLQISFSPVSQ